MMHDGRRPGQAASRLALLCLICVFTLPAAVLAGQSADIPNGTKVYHIISAPGDGQDADYDIWCGVRDQAGVYVSNDGGIAFSGAGAGLDIARVTSLAYRPHTGELFAGSWGHGVYVWDGRTDSWAQHDEMMAGFNYIYCMAASPGGVVVAADPDRVLYWLPAEEGSAWQTMSATGLPGAQITCLFYDSSGNLHAGMGSGQGVYRYELGATVPYEGQWQQHGSRHTDLTVYDISTGPTDALWLGAEQGVFELREGTWVQVGGAPTQVSALEVSTGSGGAEYWAGTLDGHVWCYSRDSGTWRPIVSGVPEGTRIRDFGFGSEQRLLVGADSGVYTVDGVVMPTGTPTVTSTPSATATATPPPTVPASPTPRTDMMPQVYAPIALRYKTPVHATEQ